MNEQEYIETRLEDQIDWYDKKSQTNQNWFKILRIIELFSSAVIPLLAGIDKPIPYYQIIIGSLGIIITVAAGLTTLNKFQENWIAYRTTAETLKHEKLLFQTKCKPYDDEKAFHRLVHRAESLISKENSQWTSYIKNERTHTELNQIDS